jgi:hypothetical protein
MTPRESLRSTVEVSSIYLEAAKLCLTDTVAFAKLKAAEGIARIDTWLADYGDSDG